MMSHRVICLLLVVLVCGSAAKKQLIVVSLPGGVHADYYKEQLSGTLEPIVSFFAEFSRKAAQSGDDFLVLYPVGRENLLREAVFDDDTMFLPMYVPLDLWMRDFTTILPQETLKFLYRPDYLTKAEAAGNEYDFWYLIEDELWYDLPQYRLKLDGGSVVENGVGKSISTKRVLYDNPRYTLPQLKALMERILKRQVCFLEDAGDTTGHSDGLVAFLDETTLLLGDYGFEDENIQNLRSLQDEFGNEVEIIRLPCYDPNTKKSARSRTRHVSKNSRNTNIHNGAIDLEIETKTDNSHAAGESPVTRSRPVDSAMWAYINMLVTDNAVYVPEFLDAPNQDVIDIITDNTDKKVVSVNTAALADMGGNVRCMSWQLYADTPLAQTLISHPDITTWNQIKQKKNSMTSLLKQLIQQLEDADI